MSSIELFNEQHGKGKILERVSYEVDEGFGSARDLYEKARKIDEGITLEMVLIWMRAQPNEQTRNYKNYTSYTAPFPKYEFQIDLMGVSSLWRDAGVAKGEQPKFGMGCIDVFSKKLHVETQSFFELTISFLTGKEKRKEGHKEESENCQYQSATRLH